jgi:hypothetical protein
MERHDGVEWTFKEVTMKKVCLIVLSAAFLAATAYAAMGDLVASFDNHPASGTSTHYGLAADSSYLYSYYYTTGRLIYVMTRSSGSLVNSYPCPLGTGSPNYYCRGLSYGGGEYLAMINYSMRINLAAYRSNGSLISTWTWPSGSRYGVCVEHNGTAPGTHAWNNNTSGTFWRYDTSGSVLSSFDISSTSNYDLAWDYGNNLLWYGNTSSEYVTGITTTGSYVASWRVPSAVSNPYGVAYYGQYLYVSTSSGSPDEYIWVYHCPNTVNVQPASIGRVKALYR